MNMAFGYLQVVFLLVVCSCWLWSEAAEPDEYEQLYFVYNPSTHNLIIRNVLARKHLKCYVIDLSDQDLAKVHDDHGMLEIEKKYLVMMNAVAKPTTKDAINRLDRGPCGHAPTNGTAEYFVITGF